MNGCRWAEPDVSSSKDVSGEFQRPGDARAFEGRSDLGSVRREGHTYHRLRVGEYRIYFEAKEGSLMAHYVLHCHTFADFAFRSHLPFGDDESRIEQDGGFRKYLDDPTR